MPAELREPSSWIWADITSGSFWYHVGKTAHKLHFAGEAPANEVVLWARGRGGRQFLIDDRAQEILEDRLVRLGATLIPRGRVFGYDYFELEWPTGTAAYPQEGP